jgi:DNA-binding response OmpR family regulator
VENQGHQTAWACTGQETQHHLENGAYELVILSAQLKDADILQLLPSLRQTHPDLPVVALTARNSLGLEQQVRQQGVICYLIKPLNIEELGSIVSHVSNKQA